MKRNEMYKGHASYIAWLGKFIVAYEHSVKGKISTKSDFIKLYPKTSEVFELQIKSKVHSAQIKKIENVLEKRKVTLAYNGKKCLILELCRHLRNSICHINLKSEDNKIYITDYYQKRPSSKGFLSLQTGLKFIKTFVNEYEDKYKE